jgi:hypothetical protein
MTPTGRDLLKRFESNPHGAEAAEGAPSSAHASGSTIDTDSCIAHLESLGYRVLPPVEVSKGGETLEIKTSAPRRTP